MPTKKYCNSCQEHKPIEGGENIPTQNGRRHRWSCADCKEGRAQQMKLDRFKLRQKNANLQNEIVE